jgi:hypothetical protein
MSEQFEKLKAAVNAIGMVVNTAGVAYTMELASGSLRLRRVDGFIERANLVDILTPDQGEFANRRFEYLEKCAAANARGNAVDRLGFEWVPERGRKVHRAVELTHSEPEDPEFEADQKAFLETAWKRLDRPRKKVWSPLDNALSFTFELVPSIELASAQAIHVTQPALVGQAKQLATKLGIPLFTTRDELERWAAE